MLKEKHDQWVLETVDCLRQRKARPDLGRISRMVERFHGLTVNETKESLERLTAIGVVMKVYFKGNISYRHIKKANKGPETKSSPNNPVYNTSVRIEQAIKSIVKQTGKGASFSDLEAWLISKNPETRLVKHRLETALQREINSGNVVKLGNESYILKDKFKEQHKEIDNLKNANAEKDEQKTQADIQIPSMSTVTGSVFSNDNAGVTGEPPKRGRPLSKRKKFKKTHGPDFEMPAPMKRSQSKEEDRNSPPVCGYCSNTADSNSEGIKEPLLTCKDCDAKAHPSCMDYSPDLARRALNSPWQCMDCKTCFLCDGSENADLMLFCDACDKGYHMTCHEPPLMNKPKGKWVCSLCHDEMCSEFSLEETINKLGAVKSARLSEGSNDGDEDINKKGKKRKLGRPKSVPMAKRVKTSPDSSDASKQTYDGYIDGTVGASCILTPSASPRPSDTFDYEMKMSQLGLPTSIIEDTTTYSDATNWNTDEVVKFFEDCGFQEHAQAFKEQEIDGRSLLLMQRNDVLTGLGIKLGPALKIYHKVVKLQIYSQQSST